MEASVYENGQIMGGIGVRVGLRLRDLLYGPQPTQQPLRPPVQFEPEAPASYRHSDGEQVYLLTHRRVSAPSFTPLEERFFQEGEDISYVHGLLSERAAAEQKNKPRGFGALRSLLFACRN